MTALNVEAENREEIVFIAVDVTEATVEADLLKIQTFSNFSTVTFGMGYDSDNSYTVYTLRNSTDTSSNIAFRYCTLTNSWTTFDRGASCGIIFSYDDKQYMGATDINQLEVERKTFDRRDYADREYSKSIEALAYVNDRITFPSVLEIDVGDVIVQTQYITIFNYNMLLKKLDNDTKLTDSNYYSSLQASNGNNLSSKLDSLIEKIRDDAGRQSYVGFTPNATYSALLPTTFTFSGLLTSIPKIANTFFTDASAAS